MIQSRAMLATLSISAWTARKQDKKISAEVEAAHSAYDAGKFNKLLVNKALLDPITKLTSRIREFHYCMTLPWADSGARLLPSKLFMDYTAKIRAFKAEFDKLVKDLQAAYPTEVQAARNRLGTMYDPGDYPDSYDLKEKFSVNLDFSPVPSAQDFRVDVSTEAQAELRQSITQAVSERQAEAVKATYARVRDVVSKIAERLSDEKAVFKDSLIGNAQDLCAVLDGLNITDDPKLSELARRIRTDLNVPCIQLRSSFVARHRTAELANNILAMLS